MKKIFLVLTITLFAISAFSQNNTQSEQEEWKPSQDEYTNFDISKFITPDIVRNQLGLNLDMYSNYSRSRVNNVSSSESSNSIFTGNFESYFSHYVNTRKKITSLESRLSFNGNYNSQRNYQNNYTIMDHNVENVSMYNFYIDWLNRKYFSKLFYLNYGIYGSVSYSFEQETMNNQTGERSDIKQRAFNLNISPRIGIGYGRIENVQDARQAIYIANALSKKKVLTRNLSNDELFELSQKISTVKNKRFLDSRLHLIDEITTVDSFFVSNNLLIDNGAAYFTTLYDMWQYGDLFTRKSGYEISLAARPYFYDQNRKYTPEEQKNFYNSYQYTMSLDYSYEKPFKLNWQHSVAAGVSGNISSSFQRYEQTGNIDEYTTDSKGFTVYANYSLGYYPNTRTNVRVTAQQQMLKSYYHNEGDYYDNEGSNINSISALSASLYYYFSPNLRLAGSCSLRYLSNNNGDYSNINQFASSFSVQLTYYIY